ncbi:uncharacterized protein CcaverHIS019_0601820 [Cutaneotrichosporon cavernicola]|uniref:Protein-lysine N-methyltransferase EFM4 n=1 Tax=Cutaneotrichosporon cavernicola TaxID=279322 RepID=A0AA48QXV1_9TREE|nr:uncharacterized protein CcaverHIS019_0601820 [Cutaneotrichosporon cavernicola]BEI93723.1 hypothetical protein CcaverHIS019_0601820 [Cutaneotrichosporon cavernicola]BEJ01501.1 hypothetical protein CcaverHIS631_0601830 [Cutaneotrichosporon cavernicola]BEJ09266.1 hypothetical protein CcaverHIS641_0601810 [Cutaneotrichosporon cavernicola]
MAERDDELPPSKLGTKEHWDMVYERENRVFDDVGDEGEVWFGDDAVTKMRAWAHENLPSSPTPLRVLECGSGNGTLLLSFLTWPGPDPQPFHLTGLDYSSGAVQLGASVESSRRAAIKEEDEDVLDPEDVINPTTCEWRVADLLRDDIPEEWDLVMDKGTFDALALSQELVEEKGGRLPSRVYPEQVAKLVKPGGFFLITSCNFTEEEVKRRFGVPGLGLRFHSSVPHPSFSFGGKTGQTVCTVAFQKDASSDTAPSIGPLHACVDCGGTKTEVVLADAGGVVARALGPTSNLAEVGLQRSTEIIVETVLKTVAKVTGMPAPEPTPTFGAFPSCPISFASTWLGISGCDTPLDESRVSQALAPFFGSPPVVHNDALLLGGALLTHKVPWGIALIAGTGSVAVALEVKDGLVTQAARRGGHGYLLGDDGSAWDVGRWACRVVVDAFDAGEEEGELAATIRNHFDIKSTPEVLGKVHELGPGTPIESTNAAKLRVTSLARPVLEALAKEDPLAEKAVRLAIAPLAMSAVQLVHQMYRLRGDKLSATGKASAPMLVCGGGCLRQPHYRALLLEICWREGVTFKEIVVVEDVAGEAVMGLVEKAS